MVSKRKLEKLEKLLVKEKQPQVNIYIAEGDQLKEFDSEKVIPKEELPDDENIINIIVSGVEPKDYGLDH